MYTIYLSLQPLLDIYTYFTCATYHRNFYGCILICFIRFCFSYAILCYTIGDMYTMDIH